MGAWSTAILGNDTSCEVYDRFLELYDFGEEPRDIAALILDEQKENIQYDRTNVWLGLALSCWECKTLTKEIFEEVKNIVDTQEDIRFNEELDADSAFLKKRQKVLESFIVKISKERAKPRLRKKIPVQVESLYSSGMCLSYKNLSDRYIGVFLLTSEHYKNKGSIEFWFLDFESEHIPGIEMYNEGRLFGLKKLGKEWGERAYSGNKTDISYGKADKEFFFINVAKIFKIIGKLKVPDAEKLTNNYRGGGMELNDPHNIIKVLERNRMESKVKFELSELTLSQLLKEIGVDNN